MVIKNCFNLSNITAYNTAGGICSNAVGFTIVGSSVIGVPFYNCFNTGLVKTTKGNALSIAATVTFPAIIDACYYGGEYTADDGEGKGVRDENIVEHAKDKSWYQDEALWNNKYPWDFENVCLL